MSNENYGDDNLCDDGHDVDNNNNDNNNNKEDLLGALYLEGGLNVLYND